MRFPPWLDSIKTRVTLSMLVVFLVGLWALALLTTRILERDITELVTDSQTSVTVQLAAQLDRALSVRIQALEKTAALITAEMMQDTAGLQRFLENRVLLQEMFNVSVLTLDADGISIADAPYNPARIGFNFRTFLDAFAKTLDQNRPFIGDPLIGRFSDEPLIPFSVPIRDQSGQVIGALGGAINLAQPNLLEEMTRGGYGQRGYYSIVSKDSRMVVTASVPELLMYQLPPTGVDEAIDRAMAGEEGSFRYTTVNGVDSLATLKGLDSVNWFITTISALVAALRPVAIMKRQLLFSTLLVTMLVGLTIWWLLKSQLKPIFPPSSLLDMPQVPMTLPRRYR